MWDTILHTLNGFLAAAIGFSLVDLMNKDTRIKFQLSPLFMAIVAFCFSMTIGVIWEFFEFAMDTFAGLDMQKDTIINHITSVTLDPTKTNVPITIDGIKEVIINGKALGVGGYIDIGLIDTMYDLFVNFIGAIVFFTGGMGEGDIEIALIIGLFLGIKGLMLALFIAFILGGIIASIFLILKFKERKAEIAFGPYLAIGAIISLLYSTEIINWYISLMKI